MTWHQTDAQQVLEQLNTRAEGLSAAEVTRKLEEIGYNVIAEKKKKSPLALFLSQFKDFMIIILMLSAVLAGIFGDLIDSIAILLIVILNAIVGFVQEYRAEKAMEALKKMAATSAIVIRDGNATHIPAAELVPGDIVKLEAGNIVPADLRLIETSQLKITEAALTGESEAVEKQPAAIPGADIPLGDRTNMAFKSTHVVSGRSTAIVVATGMKTELGKIAGLLQGEDSKTPLQKRLAIFGKKLAWVVLAICAIVFIVGVIRGEEPLPILLTAISLAVAAIPEALPAVVTIALAIGAKRMVKQNALIRKLPAVETLGSVTYICSDKTGTLTKNKMTVEEVYVEGRILAPGEMSIDGLNDTEKWLLYAITLNNDVIVDNNRQTLGDPTEIALYDLAMLNGINKTDLEKEMPRIEEIPFDGDRKSMTTIHRLNGRYYSFTKGALDVLVTKSNSLTDEDKAEMKEASEKMARNGLRVLGFAMKELDELPATIQADNMESDLTILGAVGMMDPPREEAMAAVHECKAAGIKPVMITGDHPLTAQNIAKRLGIIESNKDRIVTGPQLAEMSKDEFRDIVGNIRVYARVSPVQKVEIVQALQEKGEFVAMTGDGVNDAPSLKRADIGVAMGITGTDVAKEAGHMILLDDNFATIVKSVNSGRRIYDNIRKFIKYVLTGNSGEIWCIFLAPFFGLPVPLLPIHILWINLVTDGLPGLALAYEPAERGIMKRPPRHPNESIFAKGLGFHALWVGLLMGAVTIITQAFEIQSGNENWQTIVFTVLCFSQMGHVFAIRSESTSFFSQSPFSNARLFFSVLITFVLQLSIIYIPALNPIFKTAPLSLNDLLIATALSSIVFIAVEIEKLVKRLNTKQFN
ncbi:calcium-translocating P-type ATPase, PMCA-type [Flavihumibacter stibioxidans]|uniref:P-type Ca(2+) transporter n=1 Tax=Flavihumibacter stibioxidans TaxID=1834163 RepID=A0ABR7M4G0_9BACT|nr:calcium-translocating P-type ATPase, PMCA-type [Flavihumibacter stibioxidans]MBC6489399.1 calcium-translocating P-type ATPase, PMCA-type [Flavihumibacter stibioxidans]